MRKINLYLAICSFFIICNAFAQDTNLTCSQCKVGHCEEKPLTRGATDEPLTRGKKQDDLKYGQRERDLNVTRKNDELTRGQDSTTLLQGKKTIIWDVGLKQHS